MEKNLLLVSRLKENYIQNSNSKEQFLNNKNEILNLSKNLE